VTYDRPAVAAYFDDLAEGEWQRFDKSALGAIQEHIHNLYLERFVPKESLRDLDRWFTNPRAYRLLRTP